MSRMEPMRVLIRTCRGSQKIIQRTKSTTSASTTSASAQQRQQHTQASEPKVQRVVPKKAPFREEYTQEACDARRSWAEDFTGAKLPYMGQWMEDYDTSNLKGNIELPMGLVKVPVAPIGPLRLSGEYAKGEFLVPFATTEGALTAAIMRGISAINAGHGATAWTGTQHMTRGPAFVTRNPKEAIMLGKYMRAQKDRIQEEVVRKVSGHAMLQDIVPLYDLEVVHLVFQYSTADACGQNASTSCTWAALQWIMKQMPKELPGVSIQHAWIESNTTMDKKPGAFNILTTRGMQTQAKCIIPEKAINKYLQVTSEEYLTFQHYALRMTLRQNFMGGWHINPGNALTGIFLACGQDVACVADSVAGVQFGATRHNGEGGGLEWQITFPSLLVGSVGGGTGLPTQSEGLEMIGCKGAGKVRKLAEIVASVALALDISTTSALVAGKFAAGHDKLGRNRPDEKSNVKLDT